MSLASHPENGIVDVPSKYSVAETLQRLHTLVRSRGLTVFAHIDFSGDAVKVGLRMRPDDSGATVQQREGKWDSEFTGFPTAVLK